MYNSQCRTRNLFIAVATWISLALLSPPTVAAEATAIFAGGCFWCMEKPFDQLEGVLDTTSGYTGGRTKNPTYKAVSSGSSEHVEAIRITYDPDKIDYLSLLRVFWVNIDPLDNTGQFCDKGSQYRSAIFFGNDIERQQATMTKEALTEKQFPNQIIATEILPAKAFYPAEIYHQNFYEKSPIQYKYYRYRCGRDSRLKQLWQDKALPF